MRAIPNTRSATTIAVPAPWDQWKDFPIPEEIKTKDQMEAWRTSATTSHAFISGVEGLDPKMRVTEKGKGEGEDNPPASMSAYIADYDLAVSDDKVEILLADSPSPYVPNYLVKSFSSEGDSGRFKRRLVWRFEKPVRLAGMQHAKNFYKVLADRLKPSKWLGGYDVSGHKPSMYFEIGREWRETNPLPLPHSVVLGWAAEAAQDLRIADGKASPAVSLEAIAQAVADKFPGRWEGAFARGAQGLRFWDPSADNPRGCVVGDHGMICFTGPKSFVSWEEIFGVRFVDELRGDRWGKYMESVYYTSEPAVFWIFSKAIGRWRPCGLEELRRDLRNDGISFKRGKGGESSEADKLEGAIVKTNEVVAALPFVHRDSGPLEFDHSRFLNTASYYVATPAAELDAEAAGDFDLYGRRYFPWMKSFYEKWFEPPRNRPFWAPKDIPAEFIPMFINLALTKRIYEGAYFKKPPYRQSMILGGPPGVGKTFYVRGILGGLVGSVADGSSYMVEGNAFNSDVAESPINFVDDSTPSTNPEFHRRFSALLKKLQASRVLPYNKKHGAKGQVEWAGTTIVALNLDPESQRSLPALDQSNLDKTSLFQVKDGVYLPGEHEQTRILAKELPFFARFLLDWQPPEWTLAPMSYRGRYGVRAYHHEDLREAASSTGVPNTLLDVLCDMLEEWRENPAEVSASLSGAVRVDVEPGAGAAWTWEGRASRLYRELSVFAPQIMGRISSQQLTGALATLASRGFGVDKLQNGKWRIRFDDAMLRPFDPTVNTEHQT